MRSLFPRHMSCVRWGFALLLLFFFFLGGAWSFMSWRPLPACLFVRTLPSQSLTDTVATPGRSSTHKDALAACRIATSYAGGEVGVGRGEVNGEKE
ncbi:hypothetical protein DFJ73DRAFT_864164 [Zopfochytrium polystomum]|nr:hypothetical protein DFJ73DRAFT_864164 [Zopfochytrium polystomum]